MGIPIKSRQTLTGDPEDYFQNAAYTNGVTIEGKWMPVFLSLRERALLADLKMCNGIKKFVEIASVDVGIVTGANKFFLVPDATVDEFDLQKWAHPMFGRSDHVKGLVYSNSDHKSNKETGLPANFLWFEDALVENLPDNVRSYLEVGLSQNLHTRFKCRTRKTWYKVPSVYSAPIAMLKRAHHYPRLVLNSADAYTTDTAYRIRPLGVKPEALVLGFVNSLTCLTAEMEGRHYGGGVLELVPSEIERLLVPVIKATATDLNLADKRFRNATTDSEFLRLQDSFVLGQLGISQTDQESLHGAWVKLRDRRHRIPSLDEAGLLADVI
jgi:adenine-specific DNA methylase